MAQTNANLIWKIADLLRGPYQPNQYGDVILPFTILRRLDCILEPTKDEVLAEYKRIQSTKIDPDLLLKNKFQLPFYNISRWTFASLIGDPEGVADNLVDYVEHFSPNVRDVFEGFGLIDEIAKLANQAVAAQAYYRQSQDVDNEMQASRDLILSLSKSQ